MGIENLQSEPQMPENPNAQKSFNLKDPAIAKAWEDTRAHIKDEAVIDIADLPNLQKAQ